MNRFQVGGQSASQVMSDRMNQINTVAMQRYNDDMNYAQNAFGLFLNDLNSEQRLSRPRRFQDGGDTQDQSQQDQQPQQQQSDDGQSQPVGDGSQQMQTSQNQQQQEQMIQLLVMYFQSKGMDKEQIKQAIQRFVQDQSFQQQVLSSPDFKQFVQQEQQQQGQEQPAQDDQQQNDDQQGQNGQMKLVGQNTLKRFQVGGVNDIFAKVNDLRQKANQARLSGDNDTANMLDSQADNFVNGVDLLPIKQPTPIPVNAPSSGQLVDSNAVDDKAPSITGQALADFGIAGLSFITGVGDYIDSKNKDRQLEMQSDGTSLFSGDTQNDRGDYSVNQGFFRPDMHTNSRRGYQVFPSLKLGGEINLTEAQLRELKRRGLI